MPSGFCEVTGKFYPSLDSHHSIPREYGGEDSKRILLGPDIHQTIHRSVNNVKVREQFLSSLPPEARRKAEILISLIQRASACYKSKSIELDRKVEVVLSPQLNQKLVAISQDMGLSVSGTIVALLKKIIK